MDGRGKDFRDSHMVTMLKNADHIFAGYLIIPLLDRYSTRNPGQRPSNIQDLNH
jgi:hypothetical protein